MVNGMLIRQIGQHVYLIHFYLHSIMRLHHHYYQMT